MYQQFFGLRERPFDLTPNPRFLVLTAHHREALSSLHYGIRARKGLTLLVGEAGTGKTTLVRSALETERQQQALCVYVNNPLLSRSEFIECLADGFGLSRLAHCSKAVFLRELEERLVTRAAASMPTLLIVDEAQSLSYELLEEVRLLANIETSEEKLLPVVLAGQPELAQRLNDPSLRQLKQRVALRCELRPLTMLETAAYVRTRLQLAGADHPLFTDAALSVIHEHSGGIPRTISVICDNALVSAFALGLQPVDAAVVRDVCHDFDLVGGGTPMPRVSPLAPAQLTYAGRGAVLGIPEASPAPADDRQSSPRVAALPRAVARGRRRLSFF
jgi:type II secretory pathway predicted ATPase ExeA